MFYLRVLDDTLAYQVEEINIVLPHDTSFLGITPGEDLCTLVTCTPTGVNTHRLLVTGSRIPYEQIQAAETETVLQEKPVSHWESQYLRGITVGVGMLLVAVTVIFIISQIQRHRRKPKRRKAGKQ